MKNQSSRLRTASTQALAMALLVLPFFPWVDSPLTGSARGYRLPRALRTVDELSAALNGDVAPRVNPFLLMYLLPLFAGQVFLSAFRRRETVVAIGLAGTVPIAAIAYAHALIGADLFSMLTPVAWLTLVVATIAVLTGCGVTLRPSHLRSDPTLPRFSLANAISMTVFVLAVLVCVLIGRHNRPH